MSTSASHQRTAGPRTAGQRTAGQRAAGPGPAGQPYPAERGAPPPGPGKPLPGRAAPGMASRASGGAPPAPGAREPYDLVTVPARQGIEAVDILRLRTGVGPVLHYSCGDTLGFLVPGGTAQSWDLPGSACTGTFREARDGRPPVSDAGWLLPPSGAAPYTDPRLLELALGEAAVTLEAADRL